MEDIREREKDRREAEREWEKDRQEHERELAKDVREASKARDKRRREQRQLRRFNDERKARPVTLEFCSCFQRTHKTRAASGVCSSGFAERLLDETLWLKLYLVDCRGGVLRHPRPPERP